MMKFFRFECGLFIFILSIFSLLTSCENPIFVEATKLYEVTFETNGGSKIDSYRTAQIEKSPVTEKSGFTFGGWYKNSSLTAKVESFPLKIESNTTLYAKWNFRGYYLIKYDLQGGSFITDAPTQYVESIDCKYIVPVNNGKTFVGWKSDGKKISTLSSEKNGDVKLVANWRNPDTCDVVLSDGRLIQDEFFDSASMSAVAVLFRDNNGYFGLGIKNSGKKKYAWCSKNAKLYSYKFDSSNVGIGVAKSFSGDYLSFWGNVDGNGNWDYICSLDTNASNSAAENYPAFNYVNNYKDFVLGKMYKDGWYMPSGEELYLIYTYINSLNSVLSKINGDLLLLDNYWSSSALLQVASGANVLEFKNPETSSFALNLENARLVRNPYTHDLVSETFYLRDNEYSVCAIRRFSW